MSRTRTLTVLAAGVALVAVGTVAAVFLVINAALLRQAGRIEQPVRATTSDYAITGPNSRVLVLTVRFRAGDQTVRTRVGGTRSPTERFPPTLRIVYDARDPDRALLAADYARGSAAKTKVVVWAAGVVLGLAVILAVVALALGGRRMLRSQIRRQVRTARPSRWPWGPDARR